ncbi:hypothetical protein EV360DRAFT_87843 [Lentinula raphanica]|nr:hypothetical protein EV360DRAFT_87843 [Lentinula raphanica]
MYTKTERMKIMFVLSVCVHVVWPSLASSGLGLGSSELLSYNSHPRVVMPSVDADKLQIMSSISAIAQMLFRCVDNLAQGLGHLRSLVFGHKRIRTRPRYTPDSSQMFSQRSQTHSRSRSSSKVTRGHLNPLAPSPTLTGLTTYSSTLLPTSALSVQKARTKKEKTRIIFVVYLYPHLKLDGRSHDPQAHRIGRILAHSSNLPNTLVVVVNYSVHPSASTLRTSPSLPFPPPDNLWIVNDYVRDDPLSLSTALPHPAYRYSSSSSPPSLPSTPSSS